MQAVSSNHVINGYEPCQDKSQQAVEHEQVHTIACAQRMESELVTWGRIVSRRHRESLRGFTSNRKFRMGRPSLRKLLCRDICKRLEGLSAEAGLGARFERGQSS